jgi:hypothetical protein
MRFSIAAQLRQKMVPPLDRDHLKSASMYQQSTAEGSLSQKGMLVATL